MYSPFTDIGRVEQEVNDLRRQVSGKVDDYRMYGAESRLDCAERSVRDIRSSLSELEYRVQEMESREQEKADNDQAG